MTQWLDSYVQTNNGRIHYLRTGGDKPALVLLHGFSDNGRCWTPIAQALETEYDITMLDARGHGRSDGPEDGFSIEVLVQDAVSAIQTLGLKYPFLMGHSMGAHTAAIIAKRHPELTRGVVLEDPPWHLTEAAIAGRQDEIFMQARAYQLETVQRQSREEQLASVRQENPLWQEDEFDAWIEAKEQMKQAVFENGLEQAQRDWKVFVPDIDVPTLLIMGDIRQGALTTEQCAQLAIASYPNGRLCSIKGAGHNVRRDRRDIFLQAVIAFFREH